MMDYAAGDTVHHIISILSTFQGVSVTPTGVTVVVYRLGSAVESSAGVTATAGYDSKTGALEITIDTSADGSFYEEGNRYEVAATAITIDGTSVGFTKLFDFSLGIIKSQVQAYMRTAMADSVAALGSMATPEQALYMALQLLMERSLSGPVLTAKKPDGTTPLMTFTLDDADAPTSQTRAS